jgi:hypothetical protein
MRLQGRPNPPSDKLAVPIQIQVFSPGSTTPFLIGGAPADNNGQFSMAGIPNGVYDIAIKHSRTLSSKKQNVTFSNNTVAIDFGTLPMGDANDDDIVDISDFSILHAAFFKQCGQTGFDDRADFNADCIVDVTDFSLLRSNFLRSGPIIVSLAQAAK